MHHRPWPIGAAALALVLGVALALAPPTAAAGPLLVECRPKPNRPNAPIPDLVLFGRLDEQTMLVADPFTQHSLGGPARARITRETDSRLEFTWDTGNLRNKRGQETRFTFRATWLKPKGLMILYAKPRGYNNDFSGRGPCRETDRQLAIP